MCLASSEQVPRRTSLNLQPLEKERMRPCSHVEHYDNPGERRDTEKAVKREVTLCGIKQRSSSIEPVRIMQIFFHTSFYPYCIDKVRKVNGVLQIL